MIYFIKACSKFVKIGTSNDIDKRVKSMQTSQARTIKVVAVLNGSFQTESGLHELLKGSHYKGEWFKTTEELKWFIRAIHKYPEENHIYTLYRRSKQMRLRHKAKRMGASHKLSKKIRQYDV